MMHGHYKYPGGNQEWFVQGKLHREDGPAVIKSDGSEVWLLNDIQVEPFTPEQLPLVLLSIIKL